MVCLGINLNTCHRRLGNRLNNLTVFDGIEAVGRGFATPVTYILGI